MQVKIPVLLCGTLLWLSPFLWAQDAATREAVRQGRAAFDSSASHSPAETMRQAIAFERYKDIAAAAEARKEAGRSYQNNSADRRAEQTPRGNRIGDPGPGNMREK